MNHSPRFTTKVYPLAVLAVELDISILPHPLRKTWIFYKPEKVTLWYIPHSLELKTEIVQLFWNDSVSVLVDWIFKIWSLGSSGTCPVCEVAAGKRLRKCALNFSAHLDIFMVWCINGHMDNFDFISKMSELISCVCVYFRKQKIIVVD